MQFHDYDKYYKEKFIPLRSSVVVDRGRTIVIRKAEIIEDLVAVLPRNFYKKEYVK